MTSEDAVALEAKLSDPLWRLASGEIYKIVNKQGQLVAFRPRPEQIEVLRALCAGEWLVIIKARQLGLSTAIGVFVADLILFNANFQASLVELSAALASRKLDRIVRIAIENLPSWLAAHVVIDKLNASQISLDFSSGKGKSTFFAGVNARGGTNQMLWVSEWGPIQHEDPPRSAAIRSGALPSAKNGLCVVETTWMGGKGGDLWELIEPVLSGQSNDWRVLFFPWYLDPENVSEDAVIDDAARAYFAKIEPRLQREGVTLSDAQRRWWAAERRRQGIFMMRENPTFLDECWSSPIQGSVYASAIDRARTEGRIATMPVDGSNLVHTFWDLGSPENTVVWYAQVVGREIRFIDCDQKFNGTLTQRVAAMIAKGYSFGKHYLPHDALQTERTGSNFATELRKTGLPGIIVGIPRTASVWIGINHALELFPALAFRSPQCDDGLTALAAYRTRRQGEGALSTDEPVHDWASHTADAFRMAAEAHRAGMIEFKHTTAEPKPDWYAADKKRRGMKAIKVSA